MKILTIYQFFLPCNVWAFYNSKSSITECISGSKQPARHRIKCKSVNHCIVINRSWEICWINNSIWITTNSIRSSESSTYLRRKDWRRFLLVFWFFDCLNCSNTEKNISTVTITKCIHFSTNGDIRKRKKCSSIPNRNIVAKLKQRMNEWRRKRTPNTYKGVENEPPTRRFPFEGSRMSA